MLMSVALCGSLRAALARAAFRLAVRQITTSAPRASHDNPLGLPRNDAPPQLPRRARGLPQRRRVPYVRRTVVVSSGKGGVGKSTVAGE
jgi:ATP-binding protein involved in chromosome partitioning